MPQRIPDGYHNLNWSGFFYVAGNGLGIQANNLPGTVGIIGMCGTHCPGTVSSAGGFHLMAATLTGGWGNNTLTVMPMNKDGVAIGVFVFQLTMQSATIDFTQFWTDQVERVVFTPSNGLVVFSSMTTDTN